MAWMICGTVPDASFPLTGGRWRLDGGFLHAEGGGIAPLSVQRGTPALLGTALLTCETLGVEPPTALLAGDTGNGDGSRKLYSRLAASPSLSGVRGITFHYLFPDLDGHNRVLMALEEAGPKPVLVADAGFMYVAKMSGYADAYDLFTPDAGELAFLAESPKVIARALDAGYTPLSLLMERKQITGPAADILTRCGDAPVYTADRETLASLTGFELTRGVLCAFRRPLPRSVEEVCRNARRVAVLEGIVDSTNVGAIFRSAAALNMDAVLVTPSCCDPLCRRAVRVSMGTVFQVPWAQIGTCPADWPENGIAQLHSLGFKTAAMALSDRSVSIDDSALSAEPKLAIVLGTEGDGLAHSTIAACDYTVKIPMSHGVDSLNVAAASAVAFWQLGNR